MHRDYNKKLKELIRQIKEMSIKFLEIAGEIDHQRKIEPTKKKVS